MIKYLIIDDEQMAHEIIKGYCDMLPNMQLEKHCYDALEALEFLNSNTVDLIFLDLNMPKLKGFDFLRTLTSPPQVIVTTAYSEHALEGFELNVVDYLLKPFGFERFLMAVNKAISGSNPNQVINNATNANTPKRLFLRGDKKYTQVAVDDILFIEAAGNYTKVVTPTETIITRDKISNTLALLPPDLFLQVHKSFAVSIPHIKNIEGNRIRIGEHQIPIGKMYKMNVSKLL